MRDAVNESVVFAIIAAGRGFGAAGRVQANRRQSQIVADGVKTHFAAWHCNGHVHFVAYEPGGDQMGDSAWLQRDEAAALADGLMLTGRRWRARLNERLKEIGQTDARCAALAEIAGASGGVVQRELSQRLGVEEPTIVRLVDALEAQDWVERRAHQSDRRAKVVKIKPAATQVLDRAHSIVEQMRRELLTDIDPADLAACVRVLGLLSEKLAPG